jgi:hypothetical protein
MGKSAGFAFTYESFDKGGQNSYFSFMLKGIKAMEVPQ